MRFWIFCKGPWGSERSHPRGTGEDDVKDQGCMKRHNETYCASLKRRILALAVTWSLVLYGLLSRTYEIQVVSGEKLRRLAEAQQSEEVVIAEPRGRILDRNGKALLCESWVYGAAVFPSLLADPEEAARFLRPQHPSAQQSVLEKIKKGEPFLMIQNMTETKGFGESISGGWVATAGGFSEANRRGNSGGEGGIRLTPVPGVVLVRVPDRAGPESLARDLIGFYDPVTRKGVTGIERVMDSWLRGTGYMAVCRFTDGGGRPLKGLGYAVREEIAFRGHDVVLTVDRRIQKVVEEALNKWVRRGAAVVMDATTGEVLAAAGTRSGECPWGGPGETGERVEAERLVTPHAPAPDNTGRNAPENMWVRRYDSGFLVSILVRAVEHGVYGENGITWPWPGAYVRKGPPESANTSEHPSRLRSGISEQKDRQGAPDLAVIDEAEVIKIAAAAGLCEPANGDDGEKGTDDFVSDDGWGVGPSKAEWHAAFAGEGTIGVNAIQMAQFVAMITNQGKVIRPWCVREIRYENGTALEWRKPDTGDSIKEGVANALLEAVRSESDEQYEENTVAFRGDKTSWCLGWLPSNQEGVLPRYLVVAVVEESSSGPGAGLPGSIQAFQEIMARIEELFEEG